MEEDATQIPAPPATAPVVEPRLLRVLVVDSKGSSRTAVCSLLRDCEYQVTAVKTSAEALQVLLGQARQHEQRGGEAEEAQVDLVLKEHEPPDSDAGRLLRKMATHGELLRRYPVVVMSSQDEREVVMNCLTLGAIDYLVKPLRHNELRHIWTRVWWWRRSGLGIPASGGQGPRASAAGGHPPLLPLAVPGPPLPHDLFGRSYQSSESKETKCDAEEEPTSKEGSAPDANNGSNGNGHGSNGSKEGNGTSRVHAQQHNDNGNGNGSSDDKNGHHGSNGNGASTTLAVDGAHPLAHTAEGRAPQGLGAALMEGVQQGPLSKVATGRTVALPEHDALYNTPPASSSRKRSLNRGAETDQQGVGASATAREAGAGGHQTPAGEPPAGKLKVGGAGGGAHRDRHEQRAAAATAERLYGRALLQHQQPQQPSSLLERDRGTGASAAGVVVASGGSGANNNNNASNSNHAAVGSGTAAAGVGAQHRHQATAGGGRAAAAAGVQASAAVAAGADHGGNHGTQASLSQRGQLNHATGSGSGAATAGADAGGLSVSDNNMALATHGPLAAAAGAPGAGHVALAALAVAAGAAHHELGSAAGSGGCATGGAGSDVGMGGLWGAKAASRAVHHLQPSGAPSSSAQAQQQQAPGVTAGLPLPGGWPAFSQAFAATDGGGSTGAPLGLQVPGSFNTLLHPPFGLAPHPLLGHAPLHAALSQLVSATAPSPSVSGPHNSHHHHHLATQNPAAALAAAALNMNPLAANYLNHHTMLLNQLQQQSASSHQQLAAAGSQPSSSNAQPAQSMSQVMQAAAAAAAMAEGLSVSVHVQRTKHGGGGSGSAADGPLSAVLASTHAPASGMGGGGTGGSSSATLVGGGTTHSGGGAAPGTLGALASSGVFGAQQQQQQALMAQYFQVLSHMQAAGGPGLPGVLPPLGSAGGGPAAAASALQQAVAMQQQHAAGALPPGAAAVAAAMLAALVGHPLLQQAGDGLLGQPGGGSGLPAAAGAPSGMGGGGGATPLSSSLAATAVQLPPAHAHAGVHHHRLAGGNNRHGSGAGALSPSQGLAEPLPSGGLEPPPLPSQQPAAGVPSLGAADAAAAAMQQLAALQSALLGPPPAPLGHPSALATASLVASGGPSSPSRVGNNTATAAGVQGQLPSGLLPPEALATAMQHHQQQALAASMLPAGMMLAMGPMGVPMMLPAAAAPPGLGGLPLTTMAPTASAAVAAAVARLQGPPGVMPMPPGAGGVVGMAGFLGGGMPGALCGAAGAGPVPAGRKLPLSLMAAVGAPGGMVAMPLMGAESSSRRRRAIALDKYRLKRKNLKFSTAIRYENRKTQAQARPRIKGQFAKALPAAPIALGDGLHEGAASQGRAACGAPGLGGGASGAMQAAELSHACELHEHEDEDMALGHADEEDEEYDQGADDDEMDLDEQEDDNLQQQQQRTATANNNNALQLQQAAATRAATTSPKHHMLQQHRRRKQQQHVATAACGSPHDGSREEGQGTNTSPTRRSSPPALAHNTRKPSPSSDEGASGRGAGAGTTTAAPADVGAGQAAVGSKRLHSPRHTRPRRGGSGGGGGSRSGSLGGGGGGAHKSRLAAPTRQPQPGSGAPLTVRGSAAAVAALEQEDEDWALTAVVAETMAVNLAQGLPAVEAPHNEGPAAAAVGQQDAGDGAAEASAAMAPGGDDDSTEGAKQPGARAGASSAHTHSHHHHAHHHYHHAHHRRDDNEGGSFGAPVSGAAAVATGAGGQSGSSGGGGGRASLHGGAAAAAGAGPSVGCGGEEKGGASGHHHQKQHDAQGSNTNGNGKNGSDSGSNSPDENGGGGGGGSLRQQHGGGGGAAGPDGDEAGPLPRPGSGPAQLPQQVPR